MATARFKLENARRRVQTPESLATASAEAKLRDSEEEQSAQKSTFALELLTADEDATEVVRLYRSLPSGRLLDSPLDSDTRRAWQEGVDGLQQAIFAYLPVLRDKLASDSTAEERSPSATVPRGDDG